MTIAAQNSIQEKLTVLKGIDVEVFELVESEDAVMEEIEQSDGFKQDVYEVLVRIEQISLQSSTPAASDPSCLMPRSHLSSGVASKVRLSKLMIQPFSGVLTNWMTFCDSYRTAVNDNLSLTDIEKFSYLQSLLLGLAARPSLVSHFLLRTTSRQLTSCTGGSATNRRLYLSTWIS